MGDVGDHVRESAHRGGGDHPQRSTIRLRRRASPADTRASVRAPGLLQPSLGRRPRLSLAAMRGIAEVGAGRRPRAAARHAIPDAHEVAVRAPRRLVDAADSRARPGRRRDTAATAATLRCGLRLGRLPLGGAGALGGTRRGALAGRFAGHGGVVAGGDCAAARGRVGGGTGLAISNLSTGVIPSTLNFQAVAVDRVATARFDGGRRA